MATNVRRVTWKRPDPALVRQFAEFPVANIGDAMERLDIMDGGITPIWDGARCVGTALPIYVTAGDNLAVIEALELIREGDVVCVNAGGFTGRAIMGEAAASGARSASSRCSASGPCRASSASQRARTAASVPGNSNSSRIARMYSAEPPTTIGRTPRVRHSAIAARARRWNSATDAV